MFDFFYLRDILLHIAGTADAWLGVFVLSRNPKSSQNIAFFIFALFVSMWSFSVDYFLLVSDIKWAYFWIYAVSISITGIAVGFYHLVLSFVMEDLRYKTKQLSLFYMIILFVFIGCFIPGFYVREIIYHAWGKENVLGVGYYLVYFIFAAFVILAFSILWSKYKKPSTKNRLQLKYLLYSTIFAFAFGSYFNWLLVLFGNYRYIWVGPYSSFILVAVTAYSITKRRLLDISVVISRTLAWFLTVFFYGSIYTALVIAHRTYISTDIGISFWVWTFLYGIIVGHNFQRTRLFLQTTTDRAFIKGWYDYRHVVRKIAVGLGRALTRQDIVKTLYPILQDDIDIAQVNFYFLDEKKARFTELNPITGEPGNLFLDLDHPLVEQTSTQKDIIAFDGKICVPSFSGDSLLSLFVLGKKRSGDEYADDDIELFKTISEYVAIALEYIVKPYEEVRDKFEATERKLLETERQLERSERLASLGTLTAGIAHEIRNPLGIIHSTAEELTDKLRNTQELEDFKKSILRNTKRITTIISNMLNMARTNERKVNKLDLNKIIEDSLKLVTINGIKIAKELRPVPNIMGDEEAIKQIMINLCANAVESMPQGGELRIKTYQVEKDVYIEVSDTGVGIPKENLGKIFDPFFSTRHEGSGLGLSIVYRIVKEHGGDIQVKSEVGRGATFTIRFAGVE